MVRQLPRKFPSSVQIVETVQPVNFTHQFHNVPLRYLILIFLVLWYLIISFHLTICSVRLPIYSLNFADHWFKVLFTPIYFIISTLNFTILRSISHFYPKIHTSTNFQSANFNFTLPRVFILQNHTFILQYSRLIMIFYLVCLIFLPLPYINYCWSSQISSKKINVAFL